MTCGGPISADVQAKLLHTDPLLIIWRDEAALSLIFRAEKRTRFAGRIDGNRVFRKTQKLRWTQSDSLKLGRNKLSFDLELSEGTIKVLEIQTSKKSAFTIDLLINGSRQSDGVLVLDKTFRTTSFPIRLD